MYGLKTEGVRNNVHFYGDHHIIYPCGHNVVIYNMEDKSQVFIPGIEGTEGITCLAVSPSHRFLAVCEKAEHPLCIIYDLHGIKQGQNPKRKKVLTSHDTFAKEFVSACFSPHHEKINIVTLTCPEASDSSADSKLILWNWEKSRCQALLVIPCSLDQNPQSFPTHVSFSPNDANVLIATGLNVYRFYRMQENHQMKVVHNGIQKKDLNVSSNYTCHTWLADGRIVMGTEMGELILMETSGEFKMVLQGSPR